MSALYHVRFSELLYKMQLRVIFYIIKIARIDIYLNMYAYIIGTRQAKCDLQKSCSRYRRFVREVKGRTLYSVSRQIFEGTTIFSDR